MDETADQHEAVHAVDEALAAIRGSSISELEVEWGEGRLRVHRQPAVGVEATAPPFEAAPPFDDRVVVASEHVGVFHGGAGGPFPTAGAWIGAGTLLGEIETLGMQNAVAAPIDGRVEQVLVDDGAPVEYGQPLIVMKSEGRPPEPPADEDTVEG